MSNHSQSVLAPPARGISRPRSSVDFRPEAFNSSYWSPVPPVGLPLTHYATVPDSNAGASITFPDALPPPYEQKPTHTALMDANAHNYTSSYPGDLAMSHELETSRAAFKVPTINDLSKKAKDEFRKLVQPVLDATASVYLYPVAIYIDNLDRQMSDGRAKALPEWLIAALPTQYGPVELRKIRYGENVNIPSLLGGATMTIGYSIFIPHTINLHKLQPVNSLDQADQLAIYLQLILHEMEHIVQFLRSGGDRLGWALKYLANSAIAYNGHTDQTHNRMQLERDAEAKSWSLLNYVVGAFAKDRPTFPWTFSPGYGPASELTIPIMDSTTPETRPFDISAGAWIRSKNGQWIFRVQGDGNLVVYGPHGEPAWQMQTYGKACPPYWMCCTSARTGIIFGGWHFRSKPPGTIDHYPVTLFETAPWVQPLLYLVGAPTNPIEPTKCVVKLQLTDIGELVLYLDPPQGSGWVRTNMWRTAPPYGRIETTEIPSTVGTLPAAGHGVHSWP